MTGASQPFGTAASRRGWLGKTLSHLFMKSAVVVHCEQVSDRFRLITLESPQFRVIDWRAGQKIQIGMGAAFATRTYTPIEWDTGAGRTRILGYAHEVGPGSAWIRRVQPGDSCEVFGPRTSLDASSARGVIALFGDETSIGLAHAVSRQQPGNAVQVFLEVNSGPDAGRAMTLLGLGNVECVERDPADAHLSGIERRMSALAAAGATFLLSGKASSIQRLHRALKGQGIPAARLATKAYWAPGKVGLD